MYCIYCFQPVNVICLMHVGYAFATWLHCFTVQYTYIWEPVHQTHLHTAYFLPSFSH